MTNLANLPQSTATLYLQPAGSVGAGTYLAVSSGVVGEVSVVFPVTDAICQDDLDPNGNETTSDAQALAQDVYHILLETLGSNLDDLNRGIGVEGYLSGSSLTLSTLPSIIDSQLRKDARIVSSQSSLTQTTNGEFLLNVSLEALGTILPLNFFYTPPGGLVPQ